VVRFLAILILAAAGTAPGERIPGSLPRPELERVELKAKASAHAHRAAREGRIVEPVILYQDDDFHGRAVALAGDTLDLRAVAFNDQVSSIKLRRGTRATFYENIDGKGLWFTLNCPSQPIGVRTGDYCELKHVRTDIATGHLCELREGARGCVPWWNDQISGVGQIGPADEGQPQGRIDWGENP